MMYVNHKDDDDADLVQTQIHSRVEEQNRQTRNINECTLKSLSHRRANIKLH